MSNEEEMKGYDREDNYHPEKRKPMGVEPKSLDKIFICTMVINSMS